MQFENLNNIFKYIFNDIYRCFSTSKIFFLQDWFKEFQSSQTPCGIFLSKIEKNVVSNFYQPFFNQGIDKQYEVVDQYAVACAIFDDVILDEAAVYASVELRSDLTRGQMVVDWSNVTGNACNVRIVKVINMDLIQEILKKIVS
jgi:inosine-uridine nucleoside N-ribohydrolase